VLLHQAGSRLSDRRAHRPPKPGARASRSLAESPSNRAAGQSPGRSAASALPPPRPRRDRDALLQAQPCRAGRGATAARLEGRQARSGLVVWAPLGPGREKASSSVSSRVSRSGPLDRLHHGAEGVQSGAARGGRTRRLRLSLRNALSLHRPPPPDEGSPPGPGPPRAGWPRRPAAPRTAAGSARTEASDRRSILRRCPKAAAARAMARSVEGWAACRWITATADSTFGGGRNTGRRDPEGDLHPAVQLHHHRGEAVGAAARGGRQALHRLPLQHHHEAGDGRRLPQQVEEQRGCRRG